MSRPPCEYLEAPDVLIRVDAATGEETRVDNPPADLCAWGLHAGERLKQMPPWVTRNAEAGHLWRPGDCDGCPCYTPKV